MKITTALIPAAGMGTRFLPFTKAVPKELLPLIDQPALQRIVQECADSGLTSIGIITCPGKEAIERYFSPDPYLHAFLAKKNKEQLIAPLDKLIHDISFSYVTQASPRGLGDAILCARTLVLDDYCAILLPDDIIIGTFPALAQLMAIAHKYQANVIAVQEVSPEHISWCGIVAYEKQLDDNCFLLTDVVEKPALKDAPSNLGIIG